jgi:cobalt/nickel transport system permease protein
MDVATVDLWATAGRSPLHRTSPLAKVLAAGLCLAAIIVVQNVLVVLTIYLVALAAARRSGLPLRAYAAATLYPGVFAVLYAIAAYNGSLIGPLTIIAKAITAAAVVVLVIATTPYPRLFAVARLVLPALVVDVLYMTYRSVFIVLGILGRALTAMRLRGGLLGRNAGQRLRNLATAFGVGAIRSLEVGEHTYAVMRVRGYSGRISAEGAGGLAWRDAPALAAAAALCALAFVSRYDWRTVNPYSWLPVAAAAVVLLAAVALPVQPVVGRPR